MEQAPLDAEADNSGTVLIHLNRAADHLGLSPYQVKRLIDEGRLASEKIGARTYIPVAALRDYIDSLGQAS